MTSAPWQYAISSLTVGTHTFRAEVIDRAGARGVSSTVTITVSEGNPVADSQTLATPKNTSLPIVLTGSDPRGETISYTLTSQPLHGTLSLNGALPNLTYKPAYGFVGADTFTFRVTAGTGSDVRQSSEATLTINVTDTGSVLTAISQTVTTTENVPVSFVLSGSDSRGHPVSFSFTPLAAADGTLTGTAPNLTYVHSQAGAYTLDFTVNATLAGPPPVSGRITLIVLPVNEAPVVDAGPDQSVSGHKVALFGTVTDDGRPNPPGSLTTAWSLVRGPADGSATFTTPDATSTTVTVSKDGTYVFRLTAHDGKLQGEDTCEIFFGNPNQPPVVDAGPDRALPFGLNLSDNLLANPGAENSLNGWTHVTGSWGSNTYNPAPQSGSRYFAADSNAALAELAQTVDVSTYAAEIDDGRQIFTFSAWTRVKQEDTRMDRPRIEIEYRASTASNAQILATQVLQLNATSIAWVLVADTRAAPVGTRAIRVRLIGERTGRDGYTDVYFDSLSLRAATHNILLQGFVADDALPAGNLTWQWTQTGGPSAEIGSPVGNQNGITSSDTIDASSVVLVTSPGTYTFKLSASDGELSASDTVTVTVSPDAGNQPPLVNARLFTDEGKNDLTITMSDPMTPLLGSVADDTLPHGPVVYSWSKVVGDGEVRFDDPFSLSPTVTFQQPGRYDLRLTATDGEFVSHDDITVWITCGTGNARIATDVMVVIDDSSSMPWEAIEDAKTAARQFLGQLEYFYDRGGIVAFGEPARLLQGLTSNYNKILSGINQVGEYGWTDIGDALRVAREELAAKVRPGTSQVIILLSDGGSDPWWATEQARLAQDAGIRIISVALGDYVDENLMKSVVADEADYFFVRNSDDLPELYLGLTRAICRGEGARASVYAGPDIYTVPNVLVDLFGVVDFADVAMGDERGIRWSVVSGPGPVQISDPDYAETAALFTVPGTYRLVLTASAMVGGVLRNMSDEVTVIVAGGNCAGSIRPDGIVAWWKGDGNGLDIVGGHDVTGGFTFASGQVNEAFDFTDYYAPPADVAGTSTLALARSGGFTVEGWIRPHGSYGEGYLYRWGNLRAYIYSETYDGAYVYFNPTDNYYEGHTYWYSSSWTHVAVIYDKENSCLRTYINGVLKIDNAYTLADNATDGGFRFGDLYGFSIDELSLYSRALTAEEVTAIYNLGSTGKCIEGLDLPITVSAGVDRTQPFGSTANLRGSVTEGHFVSYRLSTTWTIVSAPEGVDPSGITLTSPTSPITGARFPAAGDYTLRLTATDPDNPARTAFDEVTITVQPSPNKAPVVFLPEDTTITIEDTLTIPAYVTDDDQPNPTPTLTWSLVAGPAGGTVTFSDPAAAETTVTFNKHGVYKLRLTAFDGALSAHDDIIITVLPAANKAPIVRLGTAPDIPQNAIFALHSLVTDDGLPIGSTLTHKWTKTSGPGSALFATPTASETTVTFSAPGTYVLQLSASDGELTGSAQTVVNVTPSLKTAPTVTFAPPSVTIPSDSAIALPAAQITHDPATDPATLTYRWARVSGSAVTFSDPALLNPALTFSGPGTYVLRLTVTDGALTGYADLTLILQPGPNHPPKVFLGDNTGQPLNLSLYTTLTLEGTFSDDGQPVGCTYRRAWTILTAPAGIAPATVGLAPNPSDPQNTLKRRLTFPAEGTYQIQLAVTETLDGTDYLTGSATLTVIVGPPENTAPWVSINDGTDAPLTLPLNGILRLPALVADDGLPADGELTAAWTTLSAPPGGTVNIDPAPDPIDEFDYVLTFTAEGVYKLRLTADDGELSDYDELTITITAPGNSAPMVFTGEPIKIPLGTPLHTTAIVVDDAPPPPPPPGGTLTTTWTVVQTPTGIEPATVTITPDTAALPNTDPQTLHPVQATLTFPATGDYLLQLAASDGELTGAATLAVRVTAPDNRPPLVSIAPPPPSATNTTLTLRGTATDDGLPAVPGALTTTWTLLSAPTGGTATLATPTALETTLTLNHIPGDYTLRLTADDGELTAHADITLTVTTSPPPPPVNHAPAVAVPPAFTVTQGQAVNISGAVADDGLPAVPGTLTTTWSFAPAIGTSASATGITIADPTALTTLVTFKKAGAYTLTLTATDGELSTSASTSITVLPPETPSTPGGGGTTGSFKLFAYYPAGYIAQNSSNLYAESVATDTDGAAITVEYILTGPASAPAERRQITHTTPWYWEFRDLAPGFYTMRAIGRNTAGYEIEATPGSFTVLAPGQTGNELPEDSLLRLVTPAPSADTTEITAPTTLTGIVHVPGLAYYALEYRRAHETGSQWTPFATATGSAGDTATETPAPLGTIDPSTMRNGDYDLRIAAYIGGNATPAGVSETARITIDGKRKVGNFSIAFKDLSLPLAGLPVEIVRSYDSRDRHLQGDFGYGWNIALNAVKLTKNRPIGEDWQQDVEGASLGMRRYTLTPTRKHLITLSFPDDTMATFEVTVRGPGGTNSNLNAPIGEVYFNFTPANARTKGTLYLDTDSGTPFRAAVSGYDWSGSCPVQLTEDDGGYGYYDPYDDYGYGYSDTTLYNPTRFRYTAEDGTAYVIDEKLGLISITDPQGNKLEVVRNGNNGRIEQITHSSGQRVMIHRDAQGRVSHLTDPYGGEIDYVYDAHGDLIAVANRAAETTTFAYYTTSTDPRDEHLTHYLRDIIDPSGTLALRNEYDDDGRLIKQTDAHGNPITFEHDTSAGIEKIKNRLGHITEHRYDAEGNITRTINPDGGITDYRYENTKDPSEVTQRIDPLGRVTRFTYDYSSDGGHTVTEINHLGEATSTKYDANRRPTEIANALGYITKGAYTEKGLPASLKDASGNITKFDEYDSHGNLTRLIDTGGNARSSTYDSQDRLLTKTDTNGVTSHFTYYSATNLSVGEVAGQIASESRTFVTGDLTKKTLVTFYKYDAEGRTIETSYSDGRSLTTTYNANGKALSFTDTLGRVTKREYDATGNTIKIEYYPAPGYEADSILTEETIYDAENRPTHTKDRADVWTRNYYDSMGRIIAVYHLGSMTRAEAAASAVGYGIRISATVYDLASQLTDTYDARGYRTHHEYDGAGRRIKTLPPSLTAEPAQISLNANGDILIITREGTLDSTRATRMAYDKVGNISSTTDANGAVIKYYYDQLGRNTEIAYPDGSRIAHIYNETGRRVSTIDAEGRATRFVYDGAGRLETVIDAKDQATSFAYDDMGRKIAQIDAEARVTRYTYDDAGRRTSRTLPGGQTEYFEYNIDGTLASHMDFNREKTTYSYDGHGRLINRIPDAAALNNGALVASFAYDNAGRRTGQILRDVNNVTQWAELSSFDERGHLSEKQTPAGTIHYSYDSTGNIVGLKIIREGEISSTVRYDYDADGRLAWLEDRTGLTDDISLGDITNYTYTPTGSIESVSLPNGTATYYTYNNTHHLTNITTKYENTTIAQFLYELSPGGRRTALVERIGNAQISGDPRRTEWIYDEIYRLSRESVTSAGTGNNASLTGSINYTYTKTGNRTSRSVSGFNGLLTNVGNYTYDLNDRLLSQASAVGEGYTYDNNGNTRTNSRIGNPPLATAAPPPASDWYDDRNRLVKRVENIAGGRTIEILYDADGNRVRKRIDGIDTYYLVDTQSLTGHAQVIEEVATPAGVEPTNISVIKRYIYGLDLVSQHAWTSDESDRWHTHYFGYDGLGSVRYLTDNNGNITDQYIYEAFGTLLNAWSIDSQNPTDNVYLFAGEQWDPDLNLYYNRARYLNTDTGRFWTADEFEGVNEQPLSLNRYLYANSDPVTYTDPSGHFGMAGMAMSMNIGNMLHSTYDSVVMGAGNAIQTSIFGVRAGKAVNDVLMGFVLDETGLSLVVDGYNLLKSFFGNDERGQEALNIAEFYLAYEVYVLPWLMTPLDDEAFDVVDEIFAPQCLVAGTLVHTENGLRPIETIQRGDSVWAWNEELQQRELKRVTHTFITNRTELVEIIVEGIRIIVTPDHPFYTNQGEWIIADKLSVGDHLFEEGNATGRIIQSMRRWTESRVVYNLEVEGLHNFFVTDIGILTHNVQYNHFFQNSFVKALRNVKPIKYGKEALGKARGMSKTAHQEFHALFNSYLDSIGMRPKRGMNSRKILKHEGINTIDDLADKIRGFYKQEHIKDRRNQGVLWSELFEKEFNILKSLSAN